MSKYYSEEEVRRILSICDEMTIDECLEDMTPIELPTDEDVEKESYKIDYGGGSEGWIKSAFRQGAKWMRDKIKGGNNE